MSALDFFTGVTLFGFLAGGYASGLIQSAGSIVGLVVGTTLASRWYVPLSGFLDQFVGHQDKIAKIAAYALIVLLVSRVFGIIIAVFLKVFKIFTIVPGLKTLDKLGGTLLGFAEGALILGLSYGVAQNLFGAEFTKLLANSPLTRFVLHVGSILLPFLPKALKEIQALTPNVNLDTGTLVNGAVNAVKNNPETFQGATQQLINSGVYR